MTTLGKVLTIARVNLIRVLRDRTSTFFMFVLPIIIIVALGIQFGGSTRARIGIVAPSGDPTVEAIAAALATGEASVPFDVRRVADEADLRSRVERGLLEAGLIIPAGFTDDLVTGTPVTVRYLGTPTSVTAGLRPAVDAALGEQARRYLAAQVAAKQAPSDVATALSVAQAGSDQVPGITVEREQVGAASIYANFGQFTLGAQGQLILFMFMTSLTAATQLVLSKRWGVSRRMIASPSGIGTIITGEALGRFAIVLFQAVVIVAIASIAFGVDWGDPVAALAIILTFGLVGAGAAMLVGAVATNAEQAGSVGVFLSLALAALGGCMIPIEFMPSTMQQIALLTPHAWAISGLRALVAERADLATVAPDVAVLAVYGAVLMTVAAWRFRVSLTH